MGNSVLCAFEDEVQRDCSVAHKAKNKDSSYLTQLVFRKLFLVVSRQR